MMKLILFLCLVTGAGISTCNAQLFDTKELTYDYSSVITADSAGMVLTGKTVTLINTGDQDVTIDNYYTLSPRGYISLGGATENTSVRDTINITFSGTGTKKLNVIKETQSTD